MNTQLGVWNSILHNVAKIQPTTNVEENTMYIQNHKHVKVCFSTYTIHPKFTHTLYKTHTHKSMQQWMWKGSANYIRLYNVNTNSASDSESVDACQSWDRAPSKAPVVSLSKNNYIHCLVLVGYRNGIERDLHKQKKRLFRDLTKIN